MDKRYQDFKQRIDRKLNAMDAKISYMKEGLDGLHEALDGFKNEFDLFIDFSSENHFNHEERFAALERKVS